MARRPRARAGTRGGPRNVERPALLLVWFAICACLLAAGASPLLLRHRDLVRSAAIGFAVAAAAASVVIAFAFAFDAYASPGTWIEAADELAFLTAGLGVLLRGPVFLHPIVLAALPATVVRLLVVAAIGCGLNAAALGCVFYAEIATPARESEWDSPPSNPVRPSY